MDEQQVKGWTPIEDARNAANIMVFASRVMTAPVEVIIRKRFGSRYFGLPGFVALFAIPMWMTLWPQESATGIGWFWLLFILMQFRARIEAAWIVRRGDIVHTRYNGRPRVTRLFKRLGEQEIKGRIEPSIVLIIGLAVFVIDRPLGSYLVVASLALSANHGLMIAVDRARALEMNDVLIEQRAISEQFRDMQRI